MPLWLFNIIFNRVVRQLNERTTGMGLKLGYTSGGSGWEIKEVLYADDTVLVAETREHFQHIVNEFERAYDRIQLKFNVG